MEVLCNSEGDRQGLTGGWRQRECVVHGRGGHNVMNEVHYQSVVLRSPRGVLGAPAGPIQILEPGATRDRLT